MAHQEILVARGRAQRAALEGGHAWSDAVFGAATAAADTGTASVAVAAGLASLSGALAASPARAATSPHPPMRH